MAYLGLGREIHCSAVIHEIKVLATQEWFNELYDILEYTENPADKAWQLIFPIRQLFNSESDAWYSFAMKILASCRLYPYLLI